MDFKNGFSVHWSCSNLGDSEISEVCHASWIILVQNRSPIPLCMMSKYDDPVFIKCLNVDFEQWAVKSINQQQQYFSSSKRWSDEQKQTECIRQALNDCFVKHLVINEFDDNEITDVTQSYISYQQQQLNATQNVRGSSLTDVYITSKIDESSALNGNGLISDVKGVTLDTVGPKEIATPYSMLVQPLWFKPSPTTYLGQLISKMKLPKNKIEDSMMQMGCSITDISARRKSISENGSIGSCYHYHHYKTDTISEQHQTSLSCSPTFIIAGFMKAGSTFLFNSLSLHPQILRNLKGTGFKETGTYEATHDTKTPALRMNSFPFIEEMESSSFIFGDGTIVYGNKRYIPYYLQPDNLKLKSIFVVREPTERTKSHHRFLYPTYENVRYRNLNILVSDVMVILGDLHDLAVAALEYPKDSVNRTNLLDKMVRITK